MRDVLESHLTEATIDKREPHKCEGLFQKILNRGELSVEFHMIEDEMP